jgi:competence protein ComEC
VRLAPIIAAAIGLLGPVIAFVLPTCWPTPTPTNTPTPTLTVTQTPAPKIEITAIDFDPTVHDGDKLDEYVLIENMGGTQQDLSRWTLQDEKAHIYNFPQFELDAGASVKVWTKAGKDTSEDLYWNRGACVWHNDGDTAFLKDEEGQLIDEYTYP